LFNTRIGYPRYSHKGKIIYPPPFIVVAPPRVRVWSDRSFLFSLLLLLEEEEEVVVVLCFPVWF
jgi:hypothetical protein